VAGREYTVSFSSTAFATGTDLWELIAADDKPIEVYGLFLAVDTEVGDAAEEILPFKVMRGAATTGTGTATTPRPLHSTDAAAGFTAKALLSANSTGGSVVDLFADAFNVRVGYQLWLPEESEWETTQTAGLIEIRLMNVPADSVDISSTLFVREAG
jgi:hypothetical protein